MSKKRSESSVVDVKMLLSEDERVTLLAMANQRQQMIAEVDRLSRAIAAFGKLCAFSRGLPQDATYDFEQRGPRDIALIEVQQQASAVAAEG